jgi:hypothetical protein
MGKAPFIGGFNEFAETQSANEHSINIMPEKTDGKSAYRLAATPGLKPWIDFGVAGSTRAAKECVGRGFVVVGSSLFEIFADGTFTLRGTISTNTGRVSIDHNGFELILTDGAAGYVLNLSTNAFTAIADADFYPSSSVAVVDGYAVLVRDGTQQFFHSDLYAATVYLGLDFESAESNPDRLKAVVNDAVGLAALGTQSFEFFWNSGDANLVFQRRQGSKINYGCLATATALEVDNGVIFLGCDPDGDGGVFRVAGATPKKISNLALDKLLGQYSDQLSKATAWAYRRDGHAFYVLDIPNSNTTFVYDLSTGFWHERRSFVGGVWGRWLAECHLPIFGKAVVGSYVGSKLYTLDPTYYFDDTSIIRRERTLRPIYDDDDYVQGSFNGLTFDCLVGVGLAAPPYDNPVMALQISDDGGIHFGAERYKPLGKIGKSKTKVQFRRLGISRNRVFKVVYAFPTPFAINGVYIDASE